MAQRWGPAGAMSGQLRLTGGRRLRESPLAEARRPTTARVREAVMNMLGSRLQGCRWLDLCSGSGIMGCEALLRGAAAVVAVERDAKTAAVCSEKTSRIAVDSAQHPCGFEVIRQDLCPLSASAAGRRRDSIWSTSIRPYASGPCSASAHDAV